MTGAPLDASDPERAAALKRKVLARLTDIGCHYRALEPAIAEFGEGFPPERFAQAAGAADPAALNRVKATERGLDQLFNYLAELGALGLELSLRRPAAGRLTERTLKARAATRRRARRAP